MSIAVEVSTLRSRLLQLVVPLVLCLIRQAHSQTVEFRPIEFSEPSDNSNQVTNVQNLATEHRRLQGLEDRSSKTLDFLRFDDSLSGLPAPKPMRWVSVPTKPTKPSGLLEGLADWGMIDERRVPHTMSRDTSASDLPMGLNGLGESASKGESLLDSLRREDWLVKETMGETSLGNAGDTANGF